MKTDGSASTLCGYTTQPGEKRLSCAEALRKHPGRVDKPARVVSDKLTNINSITII